MVRGGDLPAAVPLFVLPGALLMPRSRLPLHIFEPRYLQMLDDTLRTDHRLIGMIQPAAGGIADVGCAGRVVGFSESDDGRLAISLKAISRFRVTQVEEGFAPYPRARADWSAYDADRGPAETDAGLDRDRLIAQLGRYMDGHGLSTDWDSIRSADDEVLVNALAMLLPFETGEKQALLEAATLADRRRMLETLIEFDLRSPGGEEIVQ